MTPFLRGMMEATVQTFSLPTPVVEIGSYHVPGQEGLIELRSLFQQGEYIGIDMRAGPGVDRVENVEKLTLRNQSAGTVIALSTFEHVKHFWKGVEEVKRILRPDGVLIVSTPFYFRIHQHPSDYWRFTTEAWDALLEDHFPQRLLGQQGPAKRPSNTWAIAFGPACPAITISQIAEYQAAIARLAHSPMSVLQRWRYRLASVIAGRKPFEGYLDADQFTLQLRQGVQYEQQAA
ncbi:MAG: methyltransferase domain-containing protein [Gemmatales bacterium]